MLHLLHLNPFRVVIFSPRFKDLAPLTSGAVFFAASLLLVEVPNLTTLWLPIRASPACIPPLFNLVHLAPSANAFAPHPKIRTPSSSSNNLSPSSHFVSPLFAPYPLPHVSGCSPMLPASSSSLNLLRVLQWNTGGLRAKSAELFHFMSLHPLNLICIQELNLNSSFSFRIPGYSSLRSDSTYF